MRITAVQFQNYLEMYRRQGVQHSLGRSFCDDYQISDPDLYREVDNALVERLIRVRYIR